MENRREEEFFSKRKKLNWMVKCRLKRWDGEKKENAISHRIQNIEFIKKKTIVCVTDSTLWKTGESGDMEPHGKVPVVVTPGITC